MLAWCHHCVQVGAATVLARAFASSTTLRHVDASRNNVRDEPALANALASIPKGSSGVLDLSRNMLSAAFCTAASANKGVVRTDGQLEDTTRAVRTAGASLIHLGNRRKPASYVTDSALSNKISGGSLLKILEADRFLRDQGAHEGAMVDHKAAIAGHFKAGFDGVRYSITCGASVEERHTNGNTLRDIVRRHFAKELSTVVVPPYDEFLATRTSVVRKRGRYRALAKSNRGQIS